MRKKGGDSDSENYPLSDLESPLLMLIFKLTDE